MTREKVANLPGGWIYARLQECCLVIQGQSPPGETYNAVGKGLPFFQGKAEFGDIYPIPTKWCSVPTKIAQADDILISIRAPVGPTNLCPSAACIGRGLAAIRPLSGIPARYILYALRATEQDLRRKATGTTFEAIGGADLRAHMLALAPLPEQNRIVAEIEKQFTRLDAGVAALKRARANLKRYRAAVLKAACEGRLVPTEAELARAEGRECESADELLARILEERRAKWEKGERDKLAKRSMASSADWRTKYKEPEPPDRSEPSELPDGWIWVRLEQLSTLTTSGSRGWAEHYSALGPMFIRAQDINTDQLRLESVAHVALPDSVEGLRTRVAEHDLLITITGANVTRTALVNKPIEEAYVSQHVGLVRPVSATYPPYLYCWIISPAHGRQALEKNAYGLGKPGLNLSNLRDLRVAFPPLAEQRHIVAEVERRLSLVEELEATVNISLKRAERLRQAILKRAFAGKLVPQDPSDEPASALLEPIRYERNGDAPPQRKTQQARSTAVASRVPIPLQPTLFSSSIEKKAR